MFDLPAPVPKLHSRKAALSLGNVNGFHVIARVKIPRVDHAITRVQEEQAIIGLEASNAIRRDVILLLVTITKQAAT